MTDRSRSYGLANPDRRKVLALGAASILAPAMAGCSLADRPLLAADSQPDGFPTVEALKFFATRVAETTYGRVNIEVYPSGQLGAQNDTLELAQFGGIDFIRVNIAPLNVLVPETIVPTLPFLFRSIPHMRAAMDGAPGKEILQSLTDHNLIGLAFYDSGARSFYTTDREINEPADLSGMKIRVQTSDLFVSMVEALGGNATPMAYGEVYQGLVQGVIDGAENNFPSYESSRHFEVAPIYSLTRHVMAPEILAMSRYRWEKLSPTDRDHVREAATASVSVMRQLWDRQVLELRKLLEGANVRIIEPAGHNAFVTKVEPVWNEYLDTPKLRRLAEDIFNTDANHG